MAPIRIARLRGLRSPATIRHTASTSTHFNDSLAHGSKDRAAKNDAAAEATNSARKRGTLQAIRRSRTESRRAGRSALIQRFKPPSAQRQRQNGLPAIHRQAEHDVFQRGEGGEHESDGDAGYRLGQSGNGDRKERLPSRC